jgi:hypothetical protein
MWLKFGVAPRGELTSIDEVVRGKTNLACLYCGGSLTAKKGGRERTPRKPTPGNLQARVAAD